MPASPKGHRSHGPKPSSSEARDPMDPITRRSMSPPWLHWILVVGVALVGLTIYNGPAVGWWTSSAPNETGAVTSSQCLQSKPLLPAPASPILREMEAHLASQEFRDASIARLAGAIQIRTETFDDMGPLGEDPRWVVFDVFARYLRETFPGVHRKLHLEKVNSHGLLYTWRGSEPGLKPVLLMAHQDVVPVPDSTLNEWKHPPFGGEFDGTYVWGRGAIDCKNTLIGILEAVEHLAHAGFRPRRTLLLSFGFDEEISGTRGAARLAPVIVERYGRHGVALLVDEGPGIVTLWDKNFAVPGVSEKGYMDVEIEVHVAGGHSSMPPSHTSVGVAAELVAAIESHPYKPSLPDDNPILGFMRCAAENAEAFPWTLRLFLPAPGKAGWWAEWRRAKAAALVARGGRLMRYLVTTAQAVDVFWSGVKVNALPEQARVLVNHRINIGQTSKSVKDRLTLLAGKVAKKHNLELHAFDGSGSGERRSSITLRVVGEALEPAPVSPTALTADGSGRSTPWAILSGTTRGLYGEEVLVAPAIMPANTDTKFYWNVTEHMFRFFPGWDPDHNSLDGLHTVGEKISVLAHIRTVQWYSMFIRNADESDME